MSAPVVVTTLAFVKVPFTVASELAASTSVPELTNVPSTVKSVPAPFAMVSVIPELTVTVPPLLTVTSSTVTLAVTVTLWVFNIVIEAAELVGEPCALYQLVPSLLVSHVVFAFQLPDCFDL